MYQIGFDNEKYISLQSQQIGERIAQFGGKLYLEFGGKLFDDHHASRVLPGFKPDSKLQMLKSLKDDVEIIIVINGDDIENNRTRSDIGITYDTDVLRLIDSFREIGLYVGSVVISQFKQQNAAINFSNKLESCGIKVFRHYPIKNYPYDVEGIVSEEGFGSNDYIETTRPLVVVTAPGPGSGKMATCLSQLYHEHKRGIKAGYAKFETFPVWSLPLKHPVNLAYEAATADLSDVNMIDPYHLEAYGKTAVNYNRDVEVFPVLNAIFDGIYGKSPYNSPTDMGVNMVGFCISDDKACREASRNEIIRRYFTALCDNRKGRTADDHTAAKIELLMKQASISLDERKVVKAAIERSIETGNEPAVAIELPDGRIVTGRTSDLLGAASAALLNAVKLLGDMQRHQHLIERSTIEPIQKLKVNTLGNKNPRLHTDEALIALSISAVSNELSRRALDQLSQLKGSEAHSTVILSPVDEDVYRKLGINLTCEPHYNTNKLFHK